MTLGVILLFAAIVLIFLGLAQRVLDRMQLTDKQAVFVLLLLLAGSFVNIPIAKGSIDVKINVGGALVPLGLAIYVLTRAGSAKELIRALLATLVTTGVLYAILVFLYGNVGHEQGFLDPLYVYGIVGGATAYIAGRSRRSAFISATLGVLLLDVIHLVQLMAKGQSGQAYFGGAGVFDTVVIAGIVAVLLAELVGESREALQGGPQTHDRPVGLSVEGMDGTQDGRQEQIADLGSDNGKGGEDDGK